MYISQIYSAYYAGCALKSCDESYFLPDREDEYKKLIEEINKCNRYGKHELADNYKWDSLKKTTKEKDSLEKYKKEGNSLENTKKKRDEAWLRLYSEPSISAEDGFMNIPDGIDEELPFN